MNIATADRPTRDWSTRRNRKQARLQRVAKYTKGRVVDTANILDALHALIEPGDRVCVEGNNQKQADFLSRNLADLDPARVNNIHLLLSVLGRPEHMDLFERGIASRVDFSFSGPQSLAPGADGRRPARHYRRHSHVSRIVRALFRRSHARHRTHRRRLRRCRRQLVHRREHGRDAADRRSHGVSRRHRHRAGELATGQVAARRHSGIVDRFRRRRRPSLRNRTVVHTRSGTYHRRPDSNGDAGDSRRLRKARRHAAQSWHRLRHGRHRIAASHIWQNSWDCAEKSARIGRSIRIRR